MSSCLWATEAARRKRKPLFPGSSRFNASELHHGVQKTRDGVASMQELISPLASDLNSFIDLLNNGDKEKVLLHVEYMESTKLESVPVESSMDESSSRLWSAGGSATPDLTTVKTERFENTLLLAEAIRSEVRDELKENENKGMRRASTVEPVKKEPTRVEADVDEEEPSEKEEEDEENQFNAVNIEESNGKANLPDQISSATNIPEETPVGASLPNLLRRISKLEIREEPENESISQEQIEHQEQPTSPPQLTSDKPNQLEEPPKEQKSVRVKVEDSDSEVSDTSFQAISSAIRKSFAGKVSMGQSEQAAQSPGLSKKNSLGYSRRSSGKNYVRIKQESDEMRSRDSGSLLTAKTAPSVTNRVSKRTSVFVSLPSREPISYLSNKRQSIKVKVEEPDKSIPTVNLALTQAANQPSVRPSKIPVDITNDRRDAPSTKSLSKPTGAKASLAEPTKNSDTILQDSETKTKLSRAASSRSPTKHSSPLYAASMRSRSKPGSSQSSRTTNLGSPQHGPPRLSTSERKPRSRSRSPVKALQKNTISPRKTPTVQQRSPLRASRRTSPDKVPQLSSAPSSRSPTRYGNGELSGDEPGRYSVATSASASTPGGTKLSEGLQMAPSSTGLTKSAQKLGKEKRSQNKFLTTTLNPQQPPQFNPVKTRIKNPSPIKRFLDTDAEKERIELKERRMRMNELAANKVALPPLGNNFNESKKSLQATRRSPPRKRAPSPVKREPLPSRDEARASNKIRKLGETESVGLSRRRAAVGNAQPLPEAARGRFVRERAKEKPKIEEKRTPIRPSGRSTKTPIRVGVSGSPAIRGDALPEIPSDDESLKKQKYFKNWANTPELQKLIQSNHKLNPAEIFGEVSDLRMDEVFESTSGDKK
ncbi:hypothetical protein C7M61_000347 [Candidozyma pseudohaemuli]|uniref:Inner centromere protein ARK-binding domain-containing protein n=1 Tax=Candidozyma pseudohaemuli TaxID=418784 RepID=A0A2P7YXM4_9ASCO|nr:hypothetical protein C7M61_000347 [[Candida] pseudohaemulonii]PSK40699.1 hypothetical protein C7M61_000347 [[Candida] pseudohaemulonii]